MQNSQSLKPYNTVAKSSEIELVIQKSRFIGRCIPVEDEAEATARLEEVRKRHYDATHNCYAMRIGQLTARSSDDGEPSGTAGVPILNVLTKSELTNVLCVVTRYFGGILLGAGGLIRAYTAGAARSAEAAGVRTAKPATLFALTVPYPLWQRTEAILRASAILENTEFAEVVRVRFYALDGTEKALCKELLERSDGVLTPGVLRRELLFLS